MSRSFLRFTRGCWVALAGLALVGVLAAADPGTQSDPNADEPPTAVAIFAGGCFWCMEAAFEGVDGVRSVVSGYTGGKSKDPSYAQVSSGTTGHLEAVEVRYDPAAIGYARLLEIFWHNIDPLDGGGQFCDRGSQYRSIIFVHDAEQRRLAEGSRDALEASGSLPAPIETEVREARTFYPAEAHHQDYASRNPLRYAFYTRGCGRARRLEQIWGEQAGGH